MKHLVSLLTAAVVASAAAQTQVGQVTLTPVHTPAPVKPRPVTPAPAPVKPRPVNTVPTQPSRAAQTVTTTKTVTKTSTAFVPQQAPQGWYNLTGKVTGMKTQLPKGSQVVLTLEDAAQPNKNLLQVKFSASSIPVPYQMYFNQAKLQAGKSYGVRARVVGADGKTVYSSALTALPKGSAGTLDLKVSK